MNHDCLRDGCAPTMRLRVTPPPRHHRWPVVVAAVGIFLAIVAGAWLIGSGLGGAL